MGSLSSRPKAPSTSTVVYQTAVPQPVVNVPSEPTPEQAKSQARKDGLLRRSRGKLGTIATGFLGLVGNGNNDQSAQRKTLLGE